MILKPTPLVAGTGESVVVEECQVCESNQLEPLFFAGYLPPVNTMPTIGTRPVEEKAYPALLLQCKNCTLAQLGLIVDPAILFPPTYPYTSGTTRILRENFAQLSREVAQLYPLVPSDLVIDIGSNDGTLLSNFSKSNRVLGIEPTNASKLALSRGIDTIQAFYNRASAHQALTRAGKAKLITATNVFAHIEDIHSVVESILLQLDDDGLFISESHYFPSLIETLQYDTIYHEHLRYYSLSSLRHLLQMHDLEVVHARRIPTHGGSIRAYAARKGKFPLRDSVENILQEEKLQLNPEKLRAFRHRIADSKIGLYALLRDIEAKQQRVYAVGAPSRASTLINHVGLDDSILDCVLEIKGSYKIGKYMPGTLIPVLDEEKLFQDQPEFAMLLSWHIADELMPKLTAGGYKGKYIIPLPEPHIVGSN